MQEFHYLQFVSKELDVFLEELTGKTNIFIKEVHLEPGKTVIKYEVLSEEGFLTKELVFFNNIKK